MASVLTDRSYSDLHSWCRCTWQPVTWQPQPRSRPLLSSQHSPITVRLSSLQIHSKIWWENNFHTRQHRT